jgi:hypothetical protein
LATIHLPSATKDPRPCALPIRAAERLLDWGITRRAETFSHRGRGAQRPLARENIVNNKLTLVPAYRGWPKLQINVFPLKQKAEKQTSAGFCAGLGGRHDFGRTATVCRRSQG